MFRRINFTVLAMLGFVLIGVASIGCVIFGVMEIASDDAFFNNDGLGEVLTVLGTYFTIPYMFIVFTFIALTCNIRCLDFLRSDFGVYPQHTMLVLTLMMFIVQQAVTDKYMTILHGNVTLVLILADVLVFGMFLYYRLQAAHPGMLYALMYAAKMAIMFFNAYETKGQAFFGPNGVSAMLFLCIPIVQFPLYVAGSWDQKRSINIADVFTENFNLYLSHLLHSLDIIGMYGIAFIEPHTNANHYELPEPFRRLIIFLIAIGFLANNISVLHLFYQRAGMSDAEIMFLPRTLRELSQTNNTGTNENENRKHSHERRIFQYMIFMLVACDVPFLIARFELWRRKYAPLSIFVAKNLKDTIDVVMLMMRATPTDRPQMDSPRRITDRPFF